MLDHVNKETILYYERWLITCKSCAQEIRMNSEAEEKELM